MGDICAEFSDVEIAFTRTCHALDISSTYFGGVSRDRRNVALGKPAPLTARRAVQHGSIAKISDGFDVIRPSRRRNLLRPKKPPLSSSA
jgi:hypothetical protein